MPERGEGFGCRFGEDGGFFTLFPAGSQ